ncbi:TetR/AcrR family transcriptional regulator [Pontibacillus salicampi]|uniref:TetR/AcrR family transcriptional regulator n=1 Tax=Pontibacillus salicampi TaxID=1449801 RepID=A0ABV6LRQ4_9BACI
MEEKQVHIIEQASRLFANKGFSSTSVQEIAAECGMSKGAFYLQFKSKDALLYTLLEYYWKQIQHRVHTIHFISDDPRERFTEQIKVVIEEIANHREFIIMQVREQAIPFNDTIETFIKKMRTYGFLFYKKHLLDMYGDKVETYVSEMALLSQSLIRTYIDLIITDNAELDYLDIAKAILKRTDYLIEGFLNHNDQPVITESLIQQIIPADFASNQQIEIIERLKEIKAEEKEAELSDTADVLLEEFQRETPRKAVINGMTANLEKHTSSFDVAMMIRTYCTSY